MRGAAHAAFRFGLGPAPGEMAAMDGDPRGWLAGQLVPAPLPPALAHLPSSQQRMVLQLESRKDEEKKQQIRGIFRQDSVAHLTAAFQSEQPLVERLTRFWLNHFTVSAVRPTLRPLALPFEAEAIRPHLFGPFADLLMAATRHQAMLFYLDNAGSIGPNSPVGRKRGRGLNENLGREVLELHSLGVSGGYSQEDVRSMALILTGWTVARLGQEDAGQVRFDAQRHEPGPKHLLGHRIPEAGEEESRIALSLLAKQPATARHLATKLARHFIADTPPPDAVERLTAAYLDNDGQLLPIYLCLIELDEAWQEPLAKIRTPQELAIAAARAAGRAPADTRTTRLLHRLGHAPFMALSPAGWPDDAASWIGPEAILNRIDWAYSVAGDLEQNVEPDHYLQDALGDFAASDLKQAVQRAGSRREAVAYVLASPTFQRR